MTRSITIPLAIALVLGLGGCAAGSSTTDAAAPASSPAAASSSPAEAEPASDAPDPALAGNPLVAADFCAFLDEVAPTMADDGSPEGALATFSIALSGWISDHPEQQPRYAEDMDETSSAACPASRTAVLASLKTPSFEAAF